MADTGTPPGGAGGRAADESTTTDDSSHGRLLRRGFLGVLGSLGLGTLVSGSATGTSAPTRLTGREGAGLIPKLRQRVTNEFKTRRDYSRTQLIEESDTTAHESNDRLTEEAVVAKFGKSLEHDTETGLPTTAAYDSLVAACETGEGFEDIQQADLSDAGVERSDLVDRDLNPKPLVQPETAWTYMTEGASTAQLRIAVPPAFDDPETGAEMVELYWRALTRDVPFRAYADDDLVAAAAAELDSLDAYNGPGADGTVTPGNVFRGVTPGAKRGPYVSQFLWKDRNLGRGPEDQRIQPQVVGDTVPGSDGEIGPPTDYMTSVTDWLKVQQGVVPPLDDSLPGNEYDDERRYIVTGRDMCERVHDDPPYRQVQKAAQVLIFTMNAPLDEGIPYTLKPFEKPSPSRRDVDSFTAQTTLPFNDFGPLYIEKKVLEAAEHGQKAAWHKKWNVHRRLRPEEYGGRVQAQLGDGLAVADIGAGDQSDDGAGSGNGPGNGNSSAGNGGKGKGKGNNGNGGGADSSDTDAAPTYPIPENLLNSAALARTKERFGTYLLPQAYAEGSPTHPSYPAGHSVVAGAGVTVLKALFDGDYEFPADQKVVPTEDGRELLTASELSADVMGVQDTLTVRGELNKLASNMALGRNRAGIHYRTDGIEGLRLGEQAAIRFLEDQLTLPTRAAQLADDGRIELSFETFDGEQVTITPSV